MCDSSTGEVLAKTKRTLPTDIVKYDSTKSHASQQSPMEKLMVMWCQSALRGLEKGKQICLNFEFEEPSAYVVQKLPF